MTGGRRGRRLALFPGGFRPPHAAHLAAVLDLAARPDVDEVVVIIANRSRHLPGTTTVLDAEVSRRVWAVYLQDVTKTRVETAFHSAVAHSLGYFDRVHPGDELLFCIGESDLEQGDARFTALMQHAARTGVTAQVVPAPTGSLAVRGSDLRDALARGPDGRGTFIAALPDRLTPQARAEVWRICSDGRREVHDVVAEKVRSVLARAGLGRCAEVRCARPGKLDPVFMVLLADGRRVVAKYAGDTIESRDDDGTPPAKPAGRLAAERRALRYLRALVPAGVEVPDVVHFDKETRTLVLTEVVPGAHGLEHALDRGVFDAEAAASAGRFVAACHAAGELVPPFWGEHEADRAQWLRALSRLTTGAREDGLPAPVANDMRRLAQASREAATACICHLDFRPKNIVAGPTVAVIDFESASTVGDPAYDLGVLAGAYVLAGLRAPAPSACEAALRGLLSAYRERVADRWPDVCARVVAVAGAAMLEQGGSASERDRGAPTGRQLATAAALLSRGLAGARDADTVLCDAAAGRL